MWELVPYEIPRIRYSSHAYPFQLKEDKHHERLLPFYRTMGVKRQGAFYRIRRDTFFYQPLCVRFPEPACIEPVKPQALTPPKLDEFLLRYYQILNLIRRNRKTKDGGIAQGYGGDGSLSSMAMNLQFCTS